MSVAFRYAIAFTLHQEGGYAADLGDGAGATHFGITAKTYPTLNIEALTEDQAAEIYERDFWAALQLDRLPLPLAVATFDAAVNHGPTGAAKILQGALGVPQDGVIGPVTVAAAKAQPDALRKFCLARILRYSQNAQFAKFGAVWVRRVLDGHRYCGGLPS